MDPINTVFHNETWNLKRSKHIGEAKGQSLSFEELTVRDAQGKFGGALGNKDNWTKKNVILFMQVFVNGETEAWSDSFVGGVKGGPWLIIKFRM